jgi:glycosyltransferase involved in cell wall biosynthesis
MRILFIHEVNYSNKVIFEMHEFPELLALRGHDVSFLHYPEFPDVPRRSLRARREVVPGRVHPDARITLITPPTFGGSSSERYVAPLLSTPILHHEIAKGGYDLIVLYAVPTTGWQTVAFAKRHHVPVVFRALDVSHQIRKSPLSPIIRRAEGYVYRGADLLSGNNPAMVRYCVEESGRTGPSVVNIAPVDLSHFAAAQHLDRRPELGLAPEDEVVLYMGSFFGFSGLDTVLADMTGIFASRPRLRLVLVGGGELDAELRATVADAGLRDRVVFTGVVPYAELPSYLGVADVAINPFRPELLTHVALPHKILQYMAAGIPVVSTSLEGIRAVLGEDSGVTWVDAPSGVARVAADLAARPAAERATIADRQRAVALSTFAEQSSVDSFEEALKGVG